MEGQLDQVEITMPSTVHPSATPVVVPTIYAAQWDDGFGARGWELDVPDLGADVIPATPYTGERIPTSVFAHDLVDHDLCGFRLSGHHAVEFHFTEPVRQRYVVAVAPPPEP